MYFFYYFYIFLISISPYLNTSNINETQIDNLCVCDSLLLVGVSPSPLPTLYEVDEGSDVAKPVMIPVASTAIPLHDLPELKVGFGFGYDKKKHIVKPSNLRDIQLITAKNQHR